MATSPHTSSSSSMQTAVYHQYHDGRSHMDYYHSGYGRSVVDDASPAGSRYPSTRDLSVQRRPSAGSNLGADNRRLAIVELDSETSSPSSSIQTPSSSSPYSSSSTNLFARRGQDRSRLALVAPPDIDAHYSIGNTPQSAPVKPRQPHSTPKAAHNRSNSEIPRHMSGHTTPRAGVQSSNIAHSLSPLHTKGRDRRDLMVDTSDLSSEPSALSARGWTVDEDIITPAIGEGKDIDTKVAGPMMVGLGVEEMWRVGREGEDSTPSSEESHYSSDNPEALRAFLGYDPTLHASAGPPPPKFALTSVSTPPPPRPPRLHSPQPSPSIRPKQILSEIVSQPASQRLAPMPLMRESDYSIDAVTASSYDGVSDDDRHVTDHPRPGSSNSIHIREGAFPAASVFLSQPHNNPATPRAPSPASPASPSSSSEGTFEDDHPKPTKNTKSAHSRASSTQHLPRSSSRASSIKSKSLSRAPSAHNIVPPPPPPTELSHDIHSSFGKRLSNMARPASRSFAVRHSLQVGGARKRKVKSAWPGAMNFADVLREKTPLARFKLYATKTNDLVNEDCGLADWIMNAKGSRNPPLPHMSPRRPSVGPGAYQHSRFVSDGSEITFPTRGDASAAIDLTYRPSKDSPTNASHTALPYPTLAQGVGLRTPGQSVTNMKSISTRTFTLASPSGSAKTLPKSSGGGTGFFASIGRKASMKRAGGLAGHAQTSSDLGHGANVPRQPRKLQSSKSQSKPPQSHSAVTRSQPTTPRSQQFIAPPPTLPGGPRAQKRSSTTVIPIKPNHGNNQPTPPRSSLDSPASSSVPNEPKMRRTTRTGSFHATSSYVASMLQSQPKEVVPPVPRSSLTYRNPYAQRDAGIEQFKANLDKLCDVLPTVDRDVLNGYLKRAGGQDILAIGAYLEDEKKGKVKQP